jgi:hypothetical protein
MGVEPIIKIISEYYKFRTKEEAEIFLEWMRNKYPDGDTHISFSEHDFGVNEVTRETLEQEYPQVVEESDEQFFDRVFNAGS